MRITRITLLIIALIIGTGLYLLVKMQLDEVEPRTFQATEESMIDSANLLAALAETEIHPDGTIDITAFRAAFHAAHQRSFDAKIYEHVKQRIGMHCYITDTKGVVLFDSNHGMREGENCYKYNDVWRTLDGKYGARSSRLIKGESDSSILYVAAPIRHHDAIWGVLTVYKAQADVLPIVQRRKRAIWLGTGMVGAGILFFVVSVFIWQYRPIARLTQYTRDIEQGKRPTLPKLGAGQEVNTLANALESMRESLEGRKYAERYVQTLTHEMKSPIAAISGAAELLNETMPDEDRKRFIGNIRAEAARSERLLNRLLELSAIEGLSHLEQTETFDFRDTIRHAVDRAIPMAEMANVSLQADLPEEAVRINGDPFILRAAITNLLENAIDFSPADAVVSIRLTVDEAAILTIDDCGPGIPDYAMEKIFERFFSLRHLTAARKGTGLGLTLVREAATLHHGSASLENKTTGGTRATFRIPVTSIG